MSDNVIQFPANDDGFRITFTDGAEVSVTGIPDVKISDITHVLQRTIYILNQVMDGEGL